MELEHIASIMLNAGQIVTSLVGLAALVANFLKPDTKTGKVVHWAGANGPMIQKAVVQAGALIQVISEIQQAIQEELAKPSPDPLKIGFMQEQLAKLQAAAPQ